MPRGSGIADTLGSALGLVVLLGALLAVDDRLHDRFLRFINETFVLRGYRGEPLLLLVFLGVSLVLVSLMLRSR